ncbi:HEAT repeat domain-containing protein [bacterium]|nr:HEAT repeat domain-containing protein [bacterium]
MIPELDILLIQLQDGRDNVRIEAARSLVKFPNKLAKSTLLKTLNDSSADVRYYSILALSTWLDSSISQAFVDMVNDSSRLVRLVVLKELARNPSSSIYEAMVDALADPDEDVRSLAADSLSRFPDRFIPKILNEFSSSNWIKRNQIFKAVSLMGSRAHDHIRKSLKKEDLHREQYYWIIKLVGEFRLKDQSRTLLNFLHSQDDEEVVIITLETLGSLGFLEIIPDLIKFLDHPVDRVREACIKALSSHGEYAVSYLMDKLSNDSRVIRLSASKALENIGDMAIAPLLDKFYDRDKEGRFWILDALKKLKVPMVKDIFISLCNDDDYDIQILSISALSEFDWDDEVLEALFQLLSNEEWKIRSEAARTLASYNSIPNEYFVQQLQIGDVNIKYWMIKIIEMKKDYTYLPILLEIFQSSDWNLKMCASDAIQKFESKPSDVFLDPLRGTDENIQYWVSRSLIGDNTSVYIEPMILCLEAKQSGIRENAYKFFESMGPKSIPYLRQAFTEIRSRLAYASIADLLAGMKSAAFDEVLSLFRSTEKDEVYWGSVIAQKMGENILPELHSLLESRDWKVRLNSLQAIEKIASKKSIYILLELLEDEYFSIRKLAVNCLGEIKDVSVASALEHLMEVDDIEMRLLVIKALGNMVSGESDDLLIHSLKDENWLIQRECLRSMGKIKSDQFIGPLISYVKVVSENLKEELMENIGYFRNASFESILSTWLAEKDELLLQKVIIAISALPKFDDYETLCKFLDHDNWSIRKEAIVALGKLKIKDAVKQLKTNLQKSDSILRVHIKEALKNILGEETWKNLLVDYVDNSRLEQAEKFFKDAKTFAQKKDWKSVISSLTKAKALSDQVKYLNLQAKAYAEVQDYKKAEERGYFKIDCLNVSIYKNT